MYFCSVLPKFRISMRRVSGKRKEKEMRKVIIYFSSRTARFYRNFFWIWLSLILLVSSIPHLPNPNITVSGHKIRVDHLIHWFQYMTLVFLMISWLFRRNPFLYRKILLYTLFLGILMGVGDEFHQILIPGRTFSYYDMLSNAFGVITGVILAGLFWLPVKKTETQHTKTGDTVKRG